jgi:hypothetical protein
MGLFCLCVVIASSSFKLLVCVSVKVVSLCKCNISENESQIKEYLYGILNDNQKEQILKLIKNTDDTSSKDWAKVEVNIIAGLKN